MVPKMFPMVKLPIELLQFFFSYDVFSWEERNWKVGS